MGSGGGVGSPGGKKVERRLRSSPRNGEPETQSQGRGTRATCTQQRRWGEGGGGHRADPERSRGTFWFSEGSLSPPQQKRLISLLERITSILSDLFLGVSLRTPLSSSTSVPPPPPNPPATFRLHTFSSSRSLLFSHRKGGKMNGCMDEGIGPGGGAGGDGGAGTVGTAGREGRLSKPHS